MPWQSGFIQGNYTLTKILLCEKPLLVVEFESIMFCQDISFLSEICISKTDHFALVTSQYSGGPSREATKAEVTSHITQGLHFPVRRCATASLTALHLCSLLLAWRAVRGLRWAAGLGRWQFFVGWNNNHGTRIFTIVLICIMLSAWKRFERPIKVWQTMVSHFLTRL